MYSPLPQKTDTTVPWLLMGRTVKTLFDPMDCSPPVSSVHGIFHSRILEWVASPFSRGSSRPRDQTQASCIAGRSKPLILGFPSGSAVKNPSAMQEMWIQSLGQEDPLEEGMATHSSILAWRIPWTLEPGRLQSIGLQRVGHDWSDLAQTGKDYLDLSLPNLKLL